MWKRMSPLFLALVLAASAAIATPKAPDLPRLPVSPLDSIETLTGRVRVQGDGRTFVVTINPLDGSGRRQFEIETEGRPGRTLDLSVESAEVHFWMGHLVVVAPKQSKAFHFSIDSIDKFLRPRTDGPQLDTDSALAELDSLLRANYDLTRIETVSSIVSKNEQALKLPPQPKQETGRSVGIDEPDASGGPGGCGASCTTGCGDGSRCSASCSATRCARCSCPASCSCS
jgi:hypothetical protein